MAIADVERGREVAATHCTRCHVVGDINPYGGIESTPSFIGMKRLADWELRYAEFYILPPHPALVRIEEVSAERDEERPAFVTEIVLTLADVDAENPGRHCRDHPCSCRLWPLGPAFDTVRSVEQRWDMATDL